MRVALDPGSKMHGPPVSFGRNSHPQNLSALLRSPQHYCFFTTTLPSLPPIKSQKAKMADEVYDGAIGIDLGMRIELQKFASFAC